MNIWERLKQHINNIHKTSHISKRIIFRQDIIKLNHYSCYTIDSYRRALELGGYLRTLAPGVYKIVKKIPETLTKTALYWKVYPEAMKNQQDTNKWKSSLKTFPRIRI